MGNSPSQEVTEKKIIFGSVNDESHPRAGYYHNKDIIKYHTTQILLIPGELSGSFTKLKYGYAKTNKRVFYKGNPILGVNPNNFYVINRNTPGYTEYNKLNSVLGVSISTNNTKRFFYKGLLLE